MAEIAKLVVSVTQKGIKQTTKALDGLSKESEKASESTNSLSKSFTIGSAAATAYGAAVLALAASGARASDELLKMSSMAGLGTDEFQRIAFAASKFGVSNEKIADSLKDVNDKLGDFVNAGSGPMVDFFERIAPLVDVTADSFKGLSSAQSLQLYVSSLEKANLSQADMTFFMEAIANDATLLLPLFSKNGEAVRKFGDEAERLGLIVGTDVLAANKQLSNDLGTLETVMGTVEQRVASGVAPEVSNLSGILVGLIGNTDVVEVSTNLLAGTFYILSAAMKSVATVAVSVGGALGTVGDALGGTLAAASSALTGEFSEAGDIMNMVLNDVGTNASRTAQNIDDIWSGTGASVAANMAKMREEMERNNKGIKNNTSALQPFSSELDKAGKAISSTIDALELEAWSLGKTRKQIELYKLSLEGATDEQISAASASLDAIQAYNAEANALKKLKDTKTALSAAAESVVLASRSETEVYSDNLREIQVLFEQGALTQEQYSKAVAKAANDRAGALETEATALDDFAKTAQERIQGDIADVLTGKFTGSFDDILDGWTDLLIRMAAEAAAAQITESLFGGSSGGGGSGGGAFGAVADIFGSFFAGAKDRGGFVPAGQFAIAGERGPEIVTGPANVTSTKATAKQSGGNVINISLPGIQDARQAREASGQLQRAVGRAVSGAARYQ